MTSTFGGEFHDPTVPLEPLPPGPEWPRVEHTRLRRRMLYGLAKQDFREKVLKRLKSMERADAWGEPDCTGNLFAPICRNAAQLYTPDPPRVGGPKAAEAVIEAVEQGGLWALMIRGQRDTIGLREWLVRVEPYPDDAATLGYSLAFRPAFPDRVVARPRKDAPDLPGYVAEAVLLQYPDDPCQRWYWEVWSIEGPVPFHEVRTDLGPSGVVKHRLVGEAYPYWDRTGATPRPVIPYSLYHAERTGYLWDPWEWNEVVEGSLELVVQWTLYGHVLIKAGWPQRYSIGVDWGGNLDEEDEDGHPAGRATRASIPADPALVLTGVPTATEETAPPPVVGQWQLSADPEKVARAISHYERRIAALADMNPADIQRTDGDPRSGYAIAVSREAQQEARQRYRPQFERGDLETLRICAAVLGSAAGVVLPTRGYSVTYGPLTAEEIVQRIEAGEMSLAEGVSRLVRDHGMDAQTALATLKRALGLKQEDDDGGRDPRGGGGEDPGVGDGAGRGEGGGRGATREDRGDGGGARPDP